MVNPNRCVLLVAVTLAACGQERPVWEGRATEVGGVLRVENPSKPLVDPGTISADLLWSSTGPQRGDVWEAPNKVHAYEAFVYVVDRLASKVHRLSSNGEPRGFLGERGEGPGQYRRIVDAIPTAAGLFVVDGGNGRVEVLGPSGEIVSSSLLGQVVFSVVPIGGEAIAIFGMLGTEERWQKIDAAGSREPFEFPEFENTEGSDVPSSRASTWGDRLVRLRFTTPQVQFFSPAGKLEEVIDIPLPPDEATDEEIEELVREVGSVLSRDGLPSGVILQQAEQIRSRPRAKFRFRDVQLDDASGLAAIWEQNPEDFGSGNASVHLLSVEGVYLGVVEFDRAWAGFDLEDGVLYALSRDPNTDLVTLQAFRLSLPAGLLERARELVPAAVRMGRRGG